MRSTRELLESAVELGDRSSHIVAPKRVTPPASQSFASHRQVSRLNATSQRTGVPGVPGVPSIFTLHFDKSSASLLSKQQVTA